MRGIMVLYVRIGNRIVLILDKSQLGRLEIILHLGINHQNTNLTAVDDLFHIILRHHNRSGSGLSVLRQGNLAAPVQYRTEGAVTRHGKNVAGIKMLKGYHFALIGRIGL